MFFDIPGVSGVTLPKRKFCESLVDFGSWELEFIESQANLPISLSLKLTPKNLKMTPKQSPFARIQIINQRHPASWSRSNIPENKKIFFLTSGNLILIPPLQLPQSPRRFPKKKCQKTVDHKPFPKTPW